MDIILNMTHYTLNMMIFIQRAGWQEDARVDSRRVESLCMEKSGHDPCLDTKHGFCGDQGAIFFTPNETWAQPPWYM